MKIEQCYTRMKNRNRGSAERETEQLRFLKVHYIA